MHHALFRKPWVFMNNATDAGKASAAIYARVSILRTSSKRSPLS